MMEPALRWFTYVLFAYFAILNAGYVTMSFLALGSLIQQKNRLARHSLEEMLASDQLPPITLIAPAHNEVATCVESIRGFLGIDYPDVEILVVNDGSTDGTLNKLINTFELTPASHSPTADLETAPVKEVYRSQLHPILWVIDKENGGKADALNVGMKFCTTPYFCSVDVDTLIEELGLLRLVRPILDDGDTVAVGGLVRVANGCRVEGGRVQSVSLPRG